jgi:hypothetical protein
MRTKSSGHDFELYCCAICLNNYKQISQLVKREKNYAQQKRCLNFNEQIVLIIYEKQISFKLFMAIE